jgi:hypothetical protein
MASKQIQGHVSTHDIEYSANRKISTILNIMCLLMILSIVLTVRLVGRMI